MVGETQERVESRQTHEKQEPVDAAATRHAVAISASALFRRRHRHGRSQCRSEISAAAVASCVFITEDSGVSMSILG